MESLVQSKIEQRLKSLKSEHQKLDMLIEQEISAPRENQIRVQRLKKQKLAIKDEIVRLESMLLPDIIA